MPLFAPVTTAIRPAKEVAVLLVIIMVVLCVIVECCVDQLGENSM